MAYDLNRCPQTEEEFKEYFYALIGRMPGSSASDWRVVMSQAGIPPGFGPGVQANASFPLFGLTQQWSGGPKARIFLPSATADENGYFTRCIQYLRDAPGGTHGVDFVWSWDWVAGHEYSPVRGATGGVVTQPPTAPSPGGGTQPPPSGGGLTEAQVKAMIDAAIAPLQAQIANQLKIGDKIALRINSGKLMGVQAGGPTEDNKPIVLITRPEAHGWESLTVEKGE